MNLIILGLCVLVLIGLLVGLGMCRLGTRCRQRERDELLELLRRREIAMGDESSGDGTS